MPRNLPLGALIPLPLTLSGWIGLVIGTLRPQGFNFLEQGLEMSSPDDPRKTKAHFIPLTDLPISLVLGTRMREDGGGHEAFFEVCNAFKGSMGNVAVRITHVIDTGERTWEYRAERNFVPGLANRTKTGNIAQSLTWVDAIAAAIKTQIGAVAPPTTPPP